MGYSLDSSDAGCYPGTSVLVNKLGLKRQDALNEAESVAVSYRSVEVLRASPTDEFSFEYYCALHEKLFGDLYDWAGKLRTVDLSKKGTVFYPCDGLEAYGEKLFQRIAAGLFRSCSRAEFVSEIAEFYHDLNMLHPFREGNGRTQRVFITLLIRRAGYDIDFADCDTDELMMATVFAAQGVMDGLRSFFDKAIR